MSLGTSTLPAALPADAPHVRPRSRALATITLAILLVGYCVMRGLSGGGDAPMIEVSVMPPTTTIESSPSAVAPLPMALQPSSDQIPDLDFSVTPLTPPTVTGEATASGLLPGASVPSHRAVPEWDQIPLRMGSRTDTSVPR